MHTDRDPIPTTLTQAECVDRGHCARDEVEGFVSAVYRRRFGAQLREFMPHILAFRSADGELCAALGLRCGGEGRLFVEHYLDAPVQRCISQDCGFEVERQRIVELGGFAASSPGAAREMILLMIPLLRDAGMRWVVLVATRQLRNTFSRLGLKARSLATARAEQLGSAAQDWGDYYQHQPELTYGDLLAVPSISASHPPRLAWGRPSPCVVVP